MPLNNVNVGKEFLPIQKCAFRQQASWWLSTATMLNKVIFLKGALSLIEINVCCTAMP